ncbi:MAG TPA: S8 family serine peptidase [Candidatus Limnocylindria bacterium]|nr:S8 family serine peptidase [Candidatus Limnocylindria bacterium]
MSATARGGRLLRVRLVTVLLGVTLLALAAPVGAAAERSPTQRWIVQLRPSAGVHGFLGRADRSLALRPTHVFDNVLRGFSAELTDSQRRRLLSDPQVLAVVPDLPTRTAAEPQPVPPGVERVGAHPSAVRAVDGSDPELDVDIAILDTGIDRSHPDLRVVGGKNCTNTSAGWARDIHGHGTHVAGIAAARDNQLGVVGVAPGARLWSVKVLNNNGNGYVSWLICGLDWVAGLRDPADASLPRIEVVNMSLRMNGSDDGNCGRSKGDLLHQAICRLDRAGVTVVAAAGNDRYDAARVTPAAYDEVITVSALADYDGLPGGQASPFPPSECSRQDADDAFAGFSNFGADVDLIAPGVCVLSTMPGNSYGRMSGTSMATPLVAGGVALYHLHERALGRSRPTPQATRAALLALGSYDWLTETDRDNIAEPLLDVSSLDPTPGFQLGASPLVQHRGPGETATLDVWLARLGGFDGEIALDVSGLPAGASWSTAAGAVFEEAESGWRRLSFTLDAAVPSGAHQITVAGTSDGHAPQAVSVMLHVASGVAGDPAAPRSLLLSGMTSKSVALPVRVRWDRVAGAQRYELQVSRDGSPWANVTLPSGTARAVTATAWPGSAYRYRVRVRQDNSWGAWLLGASTTATPHYAGETVALTGSWTGFSNAGAYSETPAYSGQAGARATLAFSGRSVSWITTRGPGRGRARVYLDGTLAATIDLRASSVQHRRVAFAKSWATSGEHTIVVEVLGTSGRPRVDVDAIVVVSTD